MIKRLKKGSTIGLINPSFKNPTDVFERYHNMINYIERLGYKIKFGQTFTLQNGYLAGTDDIRVKDIEDMFLDKNVDAIICMRGGYGASRIVDKINYEIIKNNPKIFCGFSDITVLLNSIYQQTGIPTIHGLVSLFLGGSSIDEFSYKDFNDILTKKQYHEVKKNPNKLCKTMVDGIADGVLVGGNLSLLATLCGSDYEVDFTDKIVLIEDVEEEPYSIDRYLSCLRLRGMLDKAKGFVFGYFTDCNPSKSREGTQSYVDIIKEYVERLGKPTIYDFACGHDFPFINLPIGLRVELNATKKTITIKEEMYE